MDDSTLTQTIAALLGGIDGWDWNPSPDAEYDRDAVVIQYGRIQTEPDQQVAVRVYFADDDVETQLSIRRVQLRFRGARERVDGADRLADQAFDEIHGLSRVGGISGIRRISIAQLGADTNSREERTDNYEITLDNTEASWAIA
ncbi:MULTISPECIES: phage tail terminator protein [Microbacterium]|uniref:Minor capsid protein n=1 Tax=Microbacterium thalli TaxID=3027921 RepID=A0ABT5SKG9_9MICO|nr:MULTISPECIES: minor capsid protein [Microbacterium]MDD7963309.1 minor capsid protein [Microbacterium thalli]MDQ1215742.1 hypothetical protein [Microbacterium arborescens]